MLLNHDPPVIAGAGVVVTTMIAPHSNVCPDWHLHRSTRLPLALPSSS
jgi:hypothetical protein